MNIFVIVTKTVSVASYIKYKMRHYFLLLLSASKKPKR